MQDKVKLVIDKSIVDGFVSLSLTFNLKEFVSGFAIELLDVERNSFVTPFSYQIVEIFIDDELLITGRIERMERSQDRRITIEGRSLTAVLIDSSLSAPIQWHNVTLASLAISIGGQFGLGVQNDIVGLPTYEALTAEIDAKAFDFLNRIAEKEQVFLATTPEGNIHLRKELVGMVEQTLIAGQSGYLGASASYDGSGRFSQLTLLAQASEDSENEPLDLELSTTINDASITVHRPLVEVVEANDLATLQAIAKRRLILAISESAKLSLTLLGWRRTQDGSRLLRTGDCIELQDASLGLSKLSRWLIEGIEFSLSSGSMQTNLSLVLPSLYSDEPLSEVQPWQ